MPLSNTTLATATHQLLSFALRAPRADPTTAASLQLESSAWGETHPPGSALRPPLSPSAEHRAPCFSPSPPTQPQPTLGHQLPPTIFIIQRQRRADRAQETKQIPLHFRGGKGGRRRRKEGETEGGERRDAERHTSLPVSSFQAEEAATTFPLLEERAAVTGAAGASGCPMGGRHWGGDRHREEKGGRGCQPQRTTSGSRRGGGTSVRRHDMTEGVLHVEGRVRGRVAAAQRTTDSGLGLCLALLLGLCDGLPHRLCKGVGLGGPVLLGFGQGLRHGLHDLLGRLFLGRGRGWGWGWCCLLDRRRGCGGGCDGTLDLRRGV